MPVELGTFVCWSDVAYFSGQSVGNCPLPVPNAVDKCLIFGVAWTATTGVILADILIPKWAFVRCIEREIRKELRMEQPISAVQHYERGLVLKQVQIFDQALEEFQQAARDPHHAGKAHVQIALCLRSTGCYVEAVAAFRQALTSATFSTTERLHILYLLGQTLESLGRYAETLEVYRWIRNEDPDFQDIDSRIKNIGKRGPRQSRQLPIHLWMQHLLDLWRDVQPRLLSLFKQTWSSLGRHAERLETSRWVKATYPTVRDMACRIQHLEHTPKRSNGSVASGRPAPVRRSQIDKRQHARVEVQLRSQFSSKTRKLAGQGELQDLSPWGCRVRSPIGVPVGVELECCIFPEDELNPFTVDGATVRWSRPQEFGLAFTKIRPGVQKQIAQLCRKGTPIV
jgi:tetratricopeptide (TPR) repeat protein